MTVLPFLLLALVPQEMKPWDDPSRVLVVYSTTYPDNDGDGVGDSIEVAEYYAARRGVPASRMIGLATGPTGVAYGSLADFTNEVKLPVRGRLQSLGETSIDTLLFIHGVPYRIQTPQGPRSLDSCMATLFNLGTPSSPVFSSFGDANPYFEDEPAIGTDLGHFDHALYKDQGKAMYLHARLDGIDAQACKDMVDRALYGQAHITADTAGYTGTAYVDYRYGPYTDAFLLGGYPWNYFSYGQADKMMAYAKFFLSAFPWKAEPYDKEIGDPGATWEDGTPASWAPDALFYGGWYNYNKYVDAFEWKVGSIACDLNSDSADRMRDATASEFLTNAFRRGLTCGAGVINEPYLSGHNRPESFLYYVVEQGYTWAEAAMVSDPKIKWMALHLGDPLYRIDTAAAVPDTHLEMPAVALMPSPVSTVKTLVADLGVGVVDAEVFSTTLDHGPTAALGSQTTGNTLFRRHQEEDLPGLVDDVPTWLRWDFQDPVGHTDSTPLYAIIPGTPAPALARMAADNTSPGPGEPLVLRFSFAAAPNLYAATNVAVTVSIPSMGLVDVDVTWVVLSFMDAVLQSQDTGEMHFAVTIPPGILPPGPVTFTSTLMVGAASDSGSVTLTLP